MHPDPMPSINVSIIVPAGAAYDGHHHWWSSDGALNASVRFRVGGYSPGHIQGEPGALRELAAALVAAADQADAAHPTTDPARPAAGVVAEYQRRGAVHFHAVIRMDAATDCRCPACLAPPPAGFTAELLEAAVRQAAATVTVPCPVLDDDQGVTLTAGWGEQLDVRPIGGDDGGELSAEQVAGYVAKYATKATEALGVTLDQRVSAEDLNGLEVPAHVAELVRACWELGARPGLAKLRLRAWAHMLGFGGHFASKSRRYSTTPGALRRARVAYAIRRRRGRAIPLDAWGRPEDDEAAVVMATWRYLGSGYQSTGEAWLAAMAAARAREERRIAKEELRTTILA